MQKPETFLKKNYKKLITDRINKYQTKNEKSN